MGGLTKPALPAPIGVGRSKDVNAHAPHCSKQEHAGLKDCLVKLERGRLAEDVALAPLSRAEVDSMLETIFRLQPPVPSGFLEAFCNLTEDNPFSLKKRPDNGSPRALSASRMGSFAQHFCAPWLALAAAVSNRTGRQRTLRPNDPLVPQSARRI